MGLAAPGALDPESFWKIVRSGRTAIKTISRLDTSESGCSFGGEVPPFDLSLLPAELRPKRVARHTQLLLWAARQIKDDVDALTQRPSIRLGLATSCVSMISESGIARSKKGGLAASPYAASQSPPHAAAGAIARYLESSGDVLTVSTACAAGLEAIGLAAHDIATGATKQVIAGGADCAIGLTPLAEFVRSGFSSIRNSCPEKASRPFDVFADSGVCAEGAGLFLVEEKQAALARGARILAEIAGYGSHLDTDKDVPGSGWAGSIEKALKDAGWSAAMIDSISAWGPGHPIIDRIEAKTLVEMLGRQAATRASLFHQRSHRKSFSCRRTAAGSGGDLFLSRWTGATDRKSGCAHPRSTRLRSRKCPVFFSRVSFAECAWHWRGKCHSPFESPTARLSGIS